ncbi:hypothetical protein JAAARDRAFT_43188 [Jaapia argillacea MUCL 33604]|uniref:Uncharacterized protein n=1 Tax=Jaapia argillacea MUCL 33604 TaxID=933084 RepID=A0A067QCL9_9AGAM|nr:hypothetical protein JAAARDRAFT_43188 [Jaapia argillacea MUCL 33604]
MYECALRTWGKHKTNMGGKEIEMSETYPNKESIEGEDRLVHGSRKLRSAVSSQSPLLTHLSLLSMPKDTSKPAGVVRGREEYKRTAHLLSEVHDAISANADAHATYEKVTATFDELRLHIETEKMRELALGNSRPRLLALGCLIWLDEHLQDVYFNPDGGITYLREGLLSSIDFVIHIAARALPTISAKKMTKKESEEMFSLFIKLVIVWKDYYPFAASLYELTKGEKGTREFVARRAKKCLQNIKVHWVERYAMDLPIGKFVILDSVIPEGVPVPKSISVVKTKEMSLVEPEGNEPQLHIVLDRVAVERSEPSHPGLKDPSWSPKSLDNVDTSYVVCAAAYNIYSDSEAGLELCRTHAKLIRNASELQGTISRHKKLSKGTIFGIFGPKILRKQQELCEWKPLNGKAINLAASNEETACSYLYDYNALPSDEEALKAAHQKEAVYIENSAAGWHCHMMMEALWPNLVLTWKAITCGASAPRGPGGTACTQFAGVGYIAGLHRDIYDLGFSAGLTLEQNHDVATPYASAMIIAEHKASH